MPRPDPVIELIRNYTYHVMDRELRPIAERLEIRKNSIVRLLNVLDETIWQHRDQAAGFDYLVQLRAYKGFGNNSLRLLRAWAETHGVAMTRSPEVRAHINPEKLDALIEAWEKRESARAAGARSIKQKEAHEYGAQLLAELRQTINDNA